MSRNLLPSLAALLLAACAATPPKPAPVAPVPAPPTVATIPAGTPTAMPTRDTRAARAEFVRSTAQRFNIPAADIEAVLARAQIREPIIKAMARPAEAKPWRDYRPIFIQPSRIEAGRAFLEKNRVALQRAEDQYGVPKEIITAILGVETSYGGNKGSYPVIDALYTLAFAYPRSGNPEKVAYEDKREAFFRDELAQLFALGKEEGFDITQLKGSYAGAMGWGQFMPSSYRQYAVDGDGDGKRDLFNDLDDVFASVANYFAKKGKWQRDGKVMVPAMRTAMASDFINPGNAVTLDQTVPGLAGLGYTTTAGLTAADTAQPVSLITLDGATGPEYWVVFNNFKAITTYNISRLYATAVFQLSEAIAGRAVP
ncbi:MAG: lytic murein transglycosylase B [Proteobacteria bacterium]|uniref:lytic murein transglycosylase B n=1 Tax=Thermomonas sp. TaxID=1971895 RepID=UPI001EB41BC2|nr:lytic murein transglycosylase B [Thermomonas sp.]MBS0405865.1 lytic murein transglycosylase B [Pseudomonadota bacterium]HOV95191.1 lytic murein transglycosylase B [Thermomonas sp.]